MTNLEHLIENTLINMKYDRFQNMTHKDIIQHIKSDINYPGAFITAEQCYEICQYVHYTYCAEMHFELSEYHRNGGFI